MSSSSSSSSGLALAGRLAARLSGGSLDPAFTDTSFDEPGLASSSSSSSASASASATRHRLNWDHVRRSVTKLRDSDRGGTAASAAVAVGGADAAGTLANASHGNDAWPTPIMSRGLVDREWEDDSVEVVDAASQPLQGGDDGAVATAKTDWSVILLGVGLGVAIVLFLVFLGYLVSRQADAARERRRRRHDTEENLRAQALLTSAHTSSAFSGGDRTGLP